MTRFISGYGVNQQRLSLNKKPVFQGAKTTVLSSSDDSSTLATKPVKSSHYQANYLRFGAVSDTLSSYLDMPNSSLQEAWNNAPLLPDGTVTTEAFLIGLIDDALQDIREYKENPNPDEHTASSYLGEQYRVTSLSEDELAKLVDTFKGYIADLRKQVAVQSEDVEVVENPRRQPSNDLKRTFDDVKNAIKIFKRGDGAIKFTDESLIIQALVEIGRGPGSDVAKLLNKKLTHEHQMDRIFEQMRNQGIDVDNDSFYHSINELVDREDFPVYPSRSEDVSAISKLLQRNNKNVMLRLPKGMDANRFVDTLIHLLDTHNTEEAFPPFFRMDFEDIIRGVEEPNRNAIPKLKEAVEDILKSNRNVVIHMRNIASFVRSQPNPEGLKHFFNDLTLNGRARLLLTPEDDHFKAKRSAQGTVQPSVDQLLGDFSIREIELPDKDDVVAYIKSERAEDLEKLTNIAPIDDATLRQAVSMAMQTGDAYVDQALEFLKLSLDAKKYDADKFNLLADEQITISPSDVKRAVIEDPDARYTIKSSREAQHINLDADELTEMTKEHLDIIGAEDAERFFEQLLRTSERSELFNDLGLKRENVALFHGPAGTGKTQSILQFANKNNIPVVMADVKSLNRQEDPQKLAEVVHNAFSSARKKSARLKEQGKPADVIVLVDDIDRGFRQISQGMGMSGINAPLLQYLDDVKKLKTEDNQQIISIATLSDAQPVAPFLNADNTESLDKVVEFNVPHFLDERTEIAMQLAYRLEEKAGQKLFDDGLDFQKVASELAGFTGEDIKNFLLKVIDKAIRMGPEGKPALVDNELVRRTQIDLSLGEENKALAAKIDPNDRMETAYHEVGHAITRAVANSVLGIEDGYVVDLITMVPQGQALGVTFSRDENTLRVKNKKTEMMAHLISAMGSTPTEELVEHNIGAGRSGDLAQSRQMALSIVAGLGMADSYMTYPDGNIPRDVQIKADQWMKHAKNIGEIIVKAYAPFVEAFTLELAGEHGVGGRETITGDEFAEKLAAFEANNPQRARKAKNKIIRYIAVHNMMPERYRLTPFLRRVKLVPTPFGERERRQSLERQRVREEAGVLVAPKYRKTLTASASSASTSSDMPSELPPPPVVQGKDQV